MNHKAICIWMCVLSQLLSMTAGDQAVCCDTKTFESVSSAQSAGYNKEFCETGTCKTMSEKIKNIIVLMLENRSFDHMLGYLSASRDDIDGCTPKMGLKCSNPLDPNDPSNDEVVYVSNDATYVQPADPEHTLGEITYQIYGTNALGNSIDLYPAPMNGFIKSYSNVYPEDGSFIMKSFDENSLPIMSSLVNEFGVIDHWFAGIPGETQPNRVMAMRAGTEGYIRNNNIKRVIKGFDGLNIFSMLDEYKTEDDTPWNVFAGDFPNVLSLKSVRSFPERFFNMTQFYEKVANGTLPFLSWVEPSYFDRSCAEPSTSQHANQHDVRNGEILIKNMYESLRKSPQWNQTLFFIYYDEHGGFFDHVPPPMAPNPDGFNTVETDHKYVPPFDFKRLGVRVPAVLISPWIRKLTTDPIVAPNGESQYCHSSLIHTIRKNYIPDAPPLSLRDEWSLTFEHLINLNSPRTDTPEVLYPDPVPDGIDCDKYTVRRINISDTALSEANLIAGLLNKANQVQQFMNDQSSLGQFVTDSFKEWLAQRVKQKMNPCKVGGCAGELCVDVESDISASVCVFRCEYECHQYQTCKLNRKKGECEWVTNRGLDALKYKNCQRLCDKMDDLKTAEEVKEEL